MRCFQTALGNARIPMVFVLAMYSVASATATIIDFETFPDSTPVSAGARITTQFSALGVTLFETTDPNGPFIRQAPHPGQSGRNALAGFGFPGQHNFRQPINMDFSPSITAGSVVGLDVGDNGLVLEAFNSANLLVDTFMVSGAGRTDGIGYYDTLSVSGEDIVRLSVRQVTAGNDDGDGYLLDDLAFTQETIPSAGDTDNDGDVDLDDLNNVRNNFGATAGPVLGDTTPFDGDVDLDDLNAVRNSFGELAGVAAVPEPGTCGLALALMIGIALWQRRGSLRGGRVSCAGFAVALFAVLAALVVAPRQSLAATLFHDDFEDGSAVDGNPVTWVSAAFPRDPATSTVTNGDFALTPSPTSPWANASGYFEGTSLVSDLVVSDVTIRTQFRAFGQDINFAERDPIPVWRIPLSLAPDGPFAHVLYENAVRREAALVP